MKDDTSGDAINRVEMWYDRRSRSWITRTIDHSGNQIGEAYYSDSRSSAEYARAEMVNAAWTVEVVKVEVVK